MSKDSFQFYRSFFQTIDALPLKYQRNLYRAIALYGLNEEEMELTSVEQAIWFSFKAQLDANWRRYHNGCKNTNRSGGAPKGNQNAKKQQQPIIKTTPKQHQNNTDNEPNINTNKNINTNTNINVNTPPIGGVGGNDKNKFFTDTIKIEKTCMNLYITPEQYKQFAQTIVNDWEIIDETDWSWRHFNNVLRVKVEAKRSSYNHNNQSSNEDNKRKREQQALQVMNDILNS